MGGGSVEPEATITAADGVARTAWTLGPEFGEQRARARTPQDDAVEFCGIATPEPPERWADVMDLSLTVTPSELDGGTGRTLTARLAITNRWTGIFRLTTLDSCVATTSVFDADGGDVFTFPWGCWQATSYYTLEPGETLEREWTSQDVDLEPGGYTVRADLHVVRVNGRPVTLSEPEAKLTVVAEAAPSRHDGRPVAQVLDHGGP